MVDAVTICTALVKEGRKIKIDIRYKYMVDAVTICNALVKGGGA